MQKFHYCIKWIGQSKPFYTLCIGCITVREHCQNTGGLHYSCMMCHIIELISQRIEFIYNFPHTAGIHRRSAEDMSGFSHEKKKNMHRWRWRCEDGACREHHLERSEPTVDEEFFPKNTLDHN